jgi:hypothetical protein
VTITLLYGCGQIETTVADMRAARAFMLQVLGAGEIEQQMAKEITDLFPPGDYLIEHFDCGEGLFQFNAPSPHARFGEHAPLHQGYLDRIGPCVTNLNYYVDDAIHARDLLAEMGAPTHIEGPSNIIASLADYGAENTRAWDDSRKFYFMGSRDLIGLDLEIMEPNFQRFARQTVQYPCFVQPRPATGDRNLKLLRLRLVVRDLEETYGNLVTLIAPASRSKPYEVREGRLAKAFRIGLGGLELEYCQPFLGGGELAEHLDRYGPGVLSVEFAAIDCEPVLARARRSGSAVEAESDLLGLTSPQAGPRRRIASRDLVGFDVVLEPFDPRVLS